MKSAYTSLSLQQDSNKLRLEFCNCTSRPFQKRCTVDSLLEPYDHGVEHNREIYESSCKAEENREGGVLVRRVLMSVVEIKHEVFEIQKNVFLPQWLFCVIFV